MFCRKPLYIQGFFRFTLFYVRIMVLNDKGFNTIVPLNDSTRIETALLSFIQQIKQYTGYTIPLEKIKKYSRHARTCKLASLFDNMNKNL